MDAAKPEVVLAELLHVATNDFYGCHAHFYGLYDLIYLLSISAAPDKKSKYGKWTRHCTSEKGLCVT